MFPLKIDFNLRHSNLVPSGDKQQPEIILHLQAILFPETILQSAIPRCSTGLNTSWISGLIVSMNAK